MTHFPLFSIVGTTATGKTAAALATAAALLKQKVVEKVVLISADSRQVYQGLEVVTGADIPPGFQVYSDQQYEYSYYANSIQTIQLHGVSILKPSQEWSVALFHQLVSSLLHQSTPKTLVLLVGGTGLYHKYAQQLSAGQHVPPDDEWRAVAATLSLDELQKILETEDPQRLATLNNSDINNPRRLIRAIEVTRGAQASSIEAHQHTTGQSQIAVDHHYLGLERPFAEVEAAIAKRVAERFVGGALQEVTVCLDATNQVHESVATATGFAELADHITGKTRAEECQQVWTVRERQYARRQLTWFKNQPNITWIHPAATAQIISHIHRFLK